MAGEFAVLFRSPATAVSLTTVTYDCNVRRLRRCQPMSNGEKLLKNYVLWTLESDCCRFQAVQVKADDPAAKAMRVSSLTEKRPKSTIELFWFRLKQHTAM